MYQTGTVYRYLALECAVVVRLLDYYFPLRGDLFVSERLKLISIGPTKLKVSGSVSTLWVGYRGTL